MTDFDDVVKNLAVDGWHAQFRASQLRLGPGLGVRFNAEDIGIHAWEHLPDEDARLDALKSLFITYWRNTCDQDIRNSLDDAATAGEATRDLRARLQAAELSDVVAVDRVALATALEELDALRLDPRRWDDS